MESSPVVAWCKCLQVSTNLWEFKELVPFDFRLRAADEGRPISIENGPYLWTTEKFNEFDLNKQTVCCKRPNSFLRYSSQITLYENIEIQVTKYFRWQLWAILRYNCCSCEARFKIQSIAKVPDLLNSDLGYQASHFPACNRPPSNYSRHPHRFTILFFKNLQPKWVYF